MTAKADLASADLFQVDAANGITYAYRRFGEASGALPVVFLQHFRGNVDNWDPTLINGIAAHREVILFDNVGVGGTTGTTPDTVEEMAADAIAFLDALELAQVDIFGFSLGGFVAQEIALIAPERVHKLVLAGTGPKGAPGMEGWAPDVIEGVVIDDNKPEGYIHVFYTGSPESLGAGQASAGRIFARQDGRDAWPSIETKNAQYRAVENWGVQDWSAVQRLDRITQPVLILQGDNDIMIPTKASYLLAALIPSAQIHVYEDASHGSIFQYAEDAATRTVAFLSA
ncbi:alpha/beta fold hydrolase [Actinoplanes sp. HUAS TT8]|uniref:alpha/beta fold hydrolase n=1 Tax=Actinoplanes sp. HUAS TT8 TaxID=3447453 RepID=UPI003F5228E0